MRPVEASKMPIPKVGIIAEKIALLEGYAHGDFIGRKFRIGAIGRERRVDAAVIGAVATGAHSSFIDLKDIVLNNNVLG